MVSSDGARGDSGWDMGVIGVRGKHGKKRVLERILRRVFLRYFESMTLAQMHEHASAQGITPGQLLRQIDAFASSSTSDGSKPKTAHSSRRYRVVMSRRPFRILSTVGRERVVDSAISV